MAAAGVAWIAAGCRLLWHSAVRTQQIRSYPAWRGICGSAICHDAAKNNQQEEESRKPKRPDVDPETSIRYLNSKAYEEAYGGKPVWFHYRRNFKGQMPPKTRRTCVRNGEIATASPCPICRDEYLVVHHKNVKLLEQFISPYSGEVLASKKTGVCQVQHKKLIIEVMKARDLGMVEKVVPFREYDYDQYFDRKTGKVL